MATATKNGVYDPTRITPPPAPNYTSTYSVLSTYSNASPLSGTTVSIDAVAVTSWGQFEGDEVYALLFDADQSTTYHEASAVTLDDGLIGSASTDVTCRLPVGSKIWLVTKPLNKAVQFNIAQGATDQGGETTGATKTSAISGANVVVGPNRRRKWRQLGIGGGVTGIV